MSQRTPEGHLAGRPCPEAVSHRLESFMHTVLVVEGHSPVPAELREVIDAGSTSVQQVEADARRIPAADRLLVWRGDELRLGERRMRWPEDAEEIRMLLQTGG